MVFLEKRINFDKIRRELWQDPHSFLGLVPFSSEKKALRIWQPGKRRVFIDVLGKKIEARLVDKDGLFECLVPPSITRLDYRIYERENVLRYDPYSFDSTISPIDIYLLKRGKHYDLYNVLGAHIDTHQGVRGTKFAVWAPNAISVFLVGDFYSWNGIFFPMRNFKESGVWEIFIPSVLENERYRFEIITKEQRNQGKSDPFGFYFEKRPAISSIVHDIEKFEWQDERWRESNRGISGPVNIYEVHLGSWKGGSEVFRNYRDLAIELAAYCKEMGFTHIELLPIMEHPLDESWGYQVTGFFAPTSRYGTPQDFQYFVNHMHLNDIGVILDWVPAHFPTDEFSLSQFDGSPLYEYKDPQKGFHPNWNTLIFNYEKLEVTNFLIASAMFWLDKMHIDGLRVDAVASMLYLDYGREKGDWKPNRYGENYNLEAIDFIKHLNRVVHQRFEKALMIAEESTPFQGVSHSEDKGGLGFDMKWNMGWMNDTLGYFKKHPSLRSQYHDELTFSMLYFYSENFILPLSHDEVVHEKASLIKKMPGDKKEQIANLRLLYSYMLCHPGKKLLFMGGEIGQLREWDCKGAVSWELLKRPKHRQIREMVKDLNHFYLTHRALWEYDFKKEGFEWISCSDRKNSILSYLRRGSYENLVCVHNFNLFFLPSYYLPLTGVLEIEEIFNTDSKKYGGTGRVNREIKMERNKKGKQEGVRINLPPLSTIILEAEFES